MPRLKDPETGKFKKDVSTGYEFYQEIVGPALVSESRERKGREGWEPDPTWTPMQIPSANYHILLVYRRKR